MEYKLVKSSFKDINKLIEYKKQTIYEYAEYSSQEEINKINNYIRNIIPRTLKDYFNIIVDNQIIGCILILDQEDGKLLDEIYLKKEYRNKGIGTSILKEIINNSTIINLWVYKKNIRAITLYKKLGFNIIFETKDRYYMRYIKI